MKKREQTPSVPSASASASFFHLVVLVLAIAASQSGFAQACSNPATPDNTLMPTDLRVDIADGSSGKLLVTWQPGPSGLSKTYYNVCRSSPNASNFQPVIYCSEQANQKPPVYKLLTPGATLVCRDDNGLLAGLSATPLVTSPPTNYYYEVQGCNSLTDCSSFYSGSSPDIGVNYNYNTPVSCSSCNLPSMQNLPSTNETGVPTTTVIGSLYATPFPCVIGTSLATCASSTLNKNQYYGYRNSGTYAGYTIQAKNMLVVNLPGSGSYCGDGELQWVARNLGFDTICVNYDNTAEQENVCASGNFSGAPLNLSGAALVAAVGNCFTNISYAKLNWAAGPTGNCLSSSSSTVDYCGKDSNGNSKSGKTGTYYYVNSPYDSVVSRITTMLQYLCTNFDVNPANLKWEQYLQGGVCSPIGQSGAAPNWSKLILGGWSQGGDMSTFAAFAAGTTSNHLHRAINLSAPPSAAPVGTTMVPASYLGAFANGTSIAPLSTIFGLVSANDYTHYCLDETISGSQPYSNSVYESVWKLMGFTSPSDEEWDLNVNSNNQPCTSATAPPTKTIEYVAPTVPFPLNSQPALNCPGASTHNFVNWAVVSPSGNGHADPLSMWNEDIDECMLLD